MYIYINGKLYSIVRRTANYWINKIIIQTMSDNSRYNFSRLHQSNRCVYIIVYGELISQRVYFVILYIVSRLISPSRIDSNTRMVVINDEKMIKTVENLISSPIYGSRTGRTRVIIIINLWFVRKTTSTHIYYNSPIVYQTL